MEKPVQVLLVEDNPGDAYLFTLTLREAGTDRFTLTHARSLEETHRTLSAGLFDIVMLDLSLPDSRGLDTVRAVLGANPALPVIVLTGTEDESTALQAVKLGAQDYLQKGSISSGMLVRSMLHAIERNRLRRELEMHNENKNKLFSIISHDLRSPFYSLVQVTKHLVDNFDTTDHETMKMHLAVIGDTSEKLYALVENLLQWAGSQTGRIQCRPAMLPLKLLTAGVIGELAENANGKGVRVHNTMNDDIRAWADKDMIRTVMRNLVSNGIKFTNPGGSIVIQAEANGERVMVTVRDSGVGMKPDQLENLFSAEKRASRPGTRGEQGTGLGLLICREFVERNGGEIRAESREGDGTTFYLTLYAHAPVEESQGDRAPA